MDIACGLSWNQGQCDREVDSKEDGCFRDDDCIRGLLGRN